MIAFWSLTKAPSSSGDCWKVSDSSAPLVADGLALPSRRISAGLPSIFGQERGLGDVGDFVLRIAAVIGDEEGDLRAVDAAGEGGEAVAVGHERALAHQRGGEVGRGCRSASVRSSREAAGCIHRLRPRWRIAASVGEAQDGRGDLPVRHAGSLRDHDLVLAVGDVEGGCRRDEKRDRHQQGDDLGRRQQATPRGRPASTGDSGRSVSSIWLRPCVSKRDQEQDRRRSRAGFSTRYEKDSVETLTCENPAAGASRAPTMGEWPRRPVQC